MPTRTETATVTKTLSNGRAFRVCTYTQPCGGRYRAIVHEITPDGDLVFRMDIGCYDTAQAAIRAASDTVFVNYADS